MAVMPVFRSVPVGLGGVLEIHPHITRDPRGAFVKTIHHTTFSELGLCTEFVEEYYTISYSGVLRGMHLQLPPHDHTKLVYCLGGKVLDVILDLRRDSPDYRRHATL